MTKAKGIRHKLPNGMVVTHAPGCSCGRCDDKRVRPKLCAECGINPADIGNICAGCHAYRDHTGHF